MNASQKSPRYTPDQTSAIVTRIIDLRMRWLRGVKAQLASRRPSLSLSGPDDPSQDTLLQNKKDHLPVVLANRD
jgi:hypothetical protein